MILVWRFPSRKAKKFFFECTAYTVHTKYAEICRLPKYELDSVNFLSEITATPRTYDDHLLGNQSQWQECFYTVELNFQIND